MVPSKRAKKQLEALRKISHVGDVTSPIDQQWEADPSDKPIVPKEKPIKGKPRRVLGLLAGKASFSTHGFKINDDDVISPTDKDKPVESQEGSLSDYAEDTSGESLEVTRQQVWRQVANSSEDKPPKEKSLLRLIKDWEPSDETLPDVDQPEKPPK